MKAIVRVPGGVEVADVKDPVPSLDEVAVAACGPCGSDVPAIELDVTPPGASVTAGCPAQD